MSVSDDAGGSKPKRDWIAIRHQYESTTISRRDLAADKQIPYGTLEKRAIREGWMQNAKLAKRTANEVDAAVTAKVKAKFARELAPWLEEQRDRFTRRSVKVVKRGLDRVETMLDDESELDAKTEAYLSKAAQTYISTGRTALGMDGEKGSNTLNLNLLTGQAVVSVNAQAPGQG